MIWAFLFSSNRTFMELKSKNALSLHLSKYGSNRTFMELKLFHKCGINCNNASVLIVPLWN